jgi:hypothetical protein
VSSAFVHWCEVCNLELLLTPEIAYNLGWDFPPKMGEFGVISPRTCGACGVEGTVWFALAVTKVSINDLTDEQYGKALRILKEKDDPRLGGRVGAGGAVSG